MKNDEIIYRDNILADLFLLIGFLIGIFVWILSYIDGIAIIGLIFCISIWIISYYCSEGILELGD